MKLARRCLAVAAFFAVFLQAGSVWAIIPPQSLLAVSFSDSLHGYVAGGYSGVDGVVAYTSDGGATWRPSQQPGYWTRAIGASLDGSSATASSDYIDTVISTADTGGSWSSETPVFGAASPHIYDVAYLSTGSVAVGQEVGTALNGNVGVIARKPDGGSWARVFTGPLYLPPNDVDPAPLTYAQLTSVDATSGGAVAWAVGAEFTDQQHSSVVRSLMYRTVDGGSTWTTDAPSPAILQDVTAVTAATTDVAFATTQLSGTGPGTRILLRRVGGAWAQLPMPSPIPTNFQANALDAYDADHLVVVGDAGKIAYTANASAATPTWISITAGTNALYGVQMLGPNSWIVAGGNETLVRFVDGVAVSPGSYAPTAPTVSITSPAPNFSLPVASINGTSADTGVGVLKVEVQIQRDGGSFWNGLTSSWVPEPFWNSAVGTTSWSYSFIPGFPAPQSVAITARATDGMSLTAQASVSSGVVDLTAPTTTLGTVTPATLVNGWKKGPVSIPYTAVDNAGGSGVASTWSSIDGAAAIAFANPTIISKDGTTTIKYWSVDVASNIETSKTLEFKADSTKPVTTSNAAANYPTGAGGTITLSPGDGAGSGIASTSWQITGTQASSGSGTAVTVPTTTGSYTLSFHSTDNVGNVEVATTALFTVSPAPPGSLEGTVTSGGTGLVGVAVSGLGVGTVNTTAGGAYSVAGITPGTYSAAYTKAGYATETTSVTITSAVKTLRNVTLVDLPPSVPTGLGYSALTTSGVTLSWNASTDPGSGVAHYKVYKNAVLLGQTPGAGVTYTATGLSPGTSYDFTVAAVDGAGNTSAPSAAKTVVTATDGGTAAVGAGATTSPVTVGSDVVTVTLNAQTPGTIGVYQGSGLPTAAPEGFQVLGKTFDISFTGTVVAGSNYTITLPYDPSITDAAALTIKVQHWTGGAWVEITPTSVDTSAHTVTFETSSLSPFVLAEPVNVTPLLPVYRFLNLKYGTHFYTATASEYNDVLNNKKADFAYEGVAYQVVPKGSEGGSIPVHRFLSKKYAYVHFYTADPGEYAHVANNMTADWHYEGVGYNVWPTGTPDRAPVNRFLNLKYGVHFYTATAGEYTTALGIPIYQWEGIGFAVVPAP